MPLPQPPAARPSAKRGNRAMSRNLIFIGMPGSGKSTVGVLAAKRLGMGFVDTDLLIQEEAGRTLQEIVDQDGYQALRHIEEQVLLKLSVENQVISTGGSAVYSDAAMRHLKANGTVVFRSEEHTSELQSRPHLVCRLLLEKKKNIEH